MTKGVESTHDNDIAEDLGTKDASSGATGSDSLSEAGARSASDAQTVPSDAGAGESKQEVSLAKGSPVTLADGRHGKNEHASTLLAGRLTSFSQVCPENRQSSSSHQRNHRDLFLANRNIHGSVVGVPSQRRGEQQETERRENLRKSKLMIHAPQIVALLLALDNSTFV